MDSLPIRVVSEYEMPPLCCVCGAPPGPAKFKVYAATWRKRRPFAVFFPLCPTCEEAYKAVDRRRRLGCWVGVGLAFLVAVIGIVAPAVMVSEGSLSVLTFVLFFAAILLGIAAYLLTPLLFSAQRRTSYQRVQRAVQIKDYRPGGTLGSGTMVLIFAHAPFGEAFRELNEHLVVK